MPVPRQPRDVRRPDRIRDACADETPPGQLARPASRIEGLRVPRLDPVIRAHVDDYSRAISHPGEQIRRVTPRLAGPVAPVHPERLRGDPRHLRVEIQQHQMITLKPGLIPDMASGRHRPPPARHMPLAPGPAEAADRAETLREQPRPPSLALTPLDPPRLQVTQHEPVVSIPARHRLSHMPPSSADHQLTGEL